jgi:hypothetical protein
MTPPSLVREPQTLEHPAELVLDARKEWYSSYEAAQVLGVSAQFVRNCFDDQTLMGHEIGTHSNRSKKYKLIHRDCLLMYLLETANFSAEDFSRRLQQLLSRRSEEELRLVKGWIEERLRRDYALEKSRSARA